MNAEKWYAEIKKHTGGMVAFACDQLAEKDALITDLVATAKQHAERTEMAEILKIANAEQFDIIQDLRKQVESLGVKPVHYKRLDDAMRVKCADVLEKLTNKMLVDFLYPRYHVISTPWSETGLLDDFFKHGKTAFWTHIDEGQIKCTPADIFKSDAETEAAEEVARETESLAHRIEYIEKKVWGDANPDLGGTILGRIENNFQADLRRHKRTRDIADENLKPVIARTETLEQQRQSDMSWTAGKIGDLRSDIDPLGRRVAALEANIVNVRKIAEGDRIEMRQLGDRFETLLKATLGEGYDMPRVSLVEQIAVLEARIADLEPGNS